jgi:hypothetical protein
VLPRRFFPAVENYVVVCAGLRCIGLETRFIELATTEQGRPALAFIGAQAFNVFWTLLLAFLLFGGLLFAQPAIN